MDERSPQSVGPKPRPSAAQISWPPAAQRALVGLLALTAVLLSVHALAYTRWSSRPSRLERTGEHAYRIDLNEADQAELLQLPGIGPHLAERIEAYRREHGSFRHVNELAAVSGVGPTVLERIRPWLHVQNATPDEDQPSILDVKKQAHARGDEAPTNGRASPSSSALKPVSEPVDVNRASVAELQHLPGIGPKRAAAIVAERARQPFRNADDLRRVPGIGPKTLARLRPLIKLRSDDQPRVKIPVS